MWSEMVLSLLSARMRISPCLAFVCSLHPPNLHPTLASPQHRAAISSPKATGATTTVDMRLTPPMPSPIVLANSAASAQPWRSTSRLILIYFFRQLVQLLVCQQAWGGREQTGRHTTRGWCWPLTFPWGGRGPLAFLQGGCGPLLPKSAQAICIGLGGYDPSGSRSVRFSTASSIVLYTYK